MHARMDAEDLDAHPACASAFITVASMPMWSAVTRSMPARARPAPRKMLPPPITHGDLDAELLRPPGSSPATRLSTAGSMPYSVVAEQRFARELHQDALVSGQLCDSSVIVPMPSHFAIKKPRRSGVFDAFNAWSPGRSSSAP